MDSRLSSSCIHLADWPLCRVLLKNNADYPWFILVPRQNGLMDMDELSKDSRHLLIDEVAALSSIIKTIFKPDKLNVGTLGNIVSQLHIHVVARFTSDILWPHGIWQATQTVAFYSEQRLDELTALLRSSINEGTLL